MKKDKHLNLVLMIIIIIILILLITTNLSNKSNVKTTYKIVEGFIEPKNYHAPQDVKLYEVDDDNKLIHFNNYV